MPAVVSHHIGVFLPISLEGKVTNRLNHMVNGPVILSFELGVLSTVMVLEVMGESIAQEDSTVLRAFHQEPHGLTLHGSLVGLRGPHLCHELVIAGQVVVRPVAVAEVAI